jgi:hypothetical protein
MGQLTNLYVSESYQGLIKLADSTTGVTGTLQYTQDGVGNNLPIQISTTQVNITGSLTVNGLPIQANVDTGSLVTTASFNAYTSSNDSRVNSLISQTGSYVTETESGSFMITGSVAGDTLTFTKGNGSQFSLQVATGSVPAGTISGSQQIVDLGFATTGSVNTKLDTGSFNSYTSSQAAYDIFLVDLIATKVDTGSFNAYTSSNDSKVNSLIAATGSYVTESETGSFATTGSNNFVGQQNINGSANITGSLNVTGEITALSASITYLETIYQTSSVIFSSGSNILGDEAGDTQTLWGKIEIPTGPVSVTGSLRTSGQIRTDSSLVAITGVQTNNINNPGSAGDITINSNVSKIILEGNTEITGTLKVTGDIFTEDNIFALGTVLTNNISNPGLDGDITISPSGIFKVIIDADTEVTGSVIATNFTGSLQGTASYATQALSASYADFASSAGTTDSALRTSVTAKNVSGVSIPKGTPCYITGSGTAGNLVGVFPADAGNPLRMPAGVVLNETLNAGDEGEAIVVGLINGVDTSAFASGDSVYVAVGGGYTNVKPTGSALIQKLGNVEKSAVNGSGVITGPGRANDVPNIQTGYFWVGNTDQVATPVSTGSFATTGSNVFVGNQTITGSLTQSGSLIHTGSINQAGNIFLRPENFSAITFNSVTQSNAVSASNIFGVLSNSTTLTGSIVVSGSNNIVLNAQRSLTPVGSLGIVYGNNNILLGGVPTLLSGSLGTVNSLFNVNGAAPTFFLPFSSSAVNQFSNNIGGNSFTINSYSGATNVQGNGLQGTLTINNYVSSSFEAQGSVAVQQSFFAGQANVITMSGNTVGGGGTGRLVASSIVAGTSNTIFSNVANNTGSLNSSLIVGTNLIVSASSGNSATTPGGLAGSTYIGRFNDASGTLANTHETVFAVGTGTGTGARRTSLLVSGSGLTVVRNGLDVTGSLTAPSITGSLEGTASYATNALSASYAPPTALPSGLVSGSSQISYTGITDVPSNIISGSAQISGLGFINETQTGSMSVATASYVLNAVSASYATNALTASFALNGGGGSAFPFTGSAVITGSLSITGSANGNVNALSISSNTASLDLNTGNFFTLQLVSGSNTFINPSNIKAGQTVNILLSTTGSGTVSFPTSVDQVSGSAYVPTATTGKDIITLVSFDSSILYLASVKNLI